MNAIIVDDEKRNITRLRRLLGNHISEVTIVGEAFNADEGVTLIKTLDPHLVFLDIQMPGKSGFELLSGLGSYNFEVIFVTAYEQYAIQAIRFSALDYLLKPVQPYELARALLKIERQKKYIRDKIFNLLAITSGALHKNEHRIALPLMNELRLVDPADIIRCESNNNYTRFHLHSGDQVLVSKGIYEYISILEDYGFIHCHQLHLVNLLYIKSLLQEDGAYELLLTNNTRIPVSRRRKDLVKDTLLRR